MHDIVVEVVHLAVDILHEPGDIVDLDSPPQDIDEHDPDDLPLTVFLAHGGDYPAALDPVLDRGAFEPRACIGAMTENAFEAPRSSKSSAVPGSLSSIISVTSLTNTDQAAFLCCLHSFFLCFSQFSVLSVTFPYDNMIISQVHLNRKCRLRILRYVHS